MENELKEPAPKYNYITPDEYLEMERNAGYKSEYYHGQVLSMGGASLRHNYIESNVQGCLKEFLKGKDCRVLGSNMRVSTPSHDIYIYPDVLLVCGEPELEDENFDTLVNPSVIFEILSPSTRSIDKGRKFFFYQQIPSLQEYIMIDSLKRFIHLTRKQPNKLWEVETLDEKSETLYIRTINLGIRLNEIYTDTGL